MISLWTIPGDPSALVEQAEIGFDSAIEKEFYQLGFKGWVAKESQWY